MDLLESMLQSEEDEEMTEASSKSFSACTGRLCSANEHCCPGTVCVDLNGRKLQLYVAIFVCYIQTRALYLHSLPVPFLFTLLLMHAETTLRPPRNERIVYIISVCVFYV